MVFFFHDLSLHSDKRPPKQGPYSCCSRPMRAEGPVVGGAARPVAGATDEDAGPVADDNAEGPVARGGDAARSLADDSAEEPVAGGRCESCGPCCR